MLTFNCEKGMVKASSLGITTACPGSESRFCRPRDLATIISSATNTITNSNAAPRPAMPMINMGSRPDETITSMVSDTLRKLVGVVVVVVKLLIILSILQELCRSTRLKKVQSLNSYS